tara:strand:- start:52 stop:1065 length:1014 start_codon:yes stop_codon:yes gene_type:complete
MGLGKSKILSQAVAAPIDNTGNFNTVLYTGNGSSDRNITGVGFNPDLTIVKSRSGGENWGLGDTVRGGGFLLYPNLSNAQVAAAYITPSAVSDGFKISTGNNNGSGINYAAWNFRAGGAASSNTSGSITSQVSANQEAGFSIVEFTTSANGTIGHGLSAAPQLIITKLYTRLGSWSTYSEPTGNTKYLQLDSNNAAATGTGRWNSTTPSASTFVLGSDFGSGHACICYCFHSVAGRQKVGSYTASNSWGSSAVIDVGFPPRFVLIKSVSNTGDWLLVDSERGGSNGQDRERIFVNLNSAGGADTTVDFTGNTFSITFGSTGNQGTANTSQYIYLAIA